MTSLSSHATHQAALLNKLHDRQALKKELQRKEKAMAEMAALLVLRKKWEAFCSEDAEG